MTAALLDHLHLKPYSSCP